MCNDIPRDSATLVRAWVSPALSLGPTAEEDVGDVDEPPDPLLASPISNHFRRTPVRASNEHHQSLLTQALQSYSDDESFERTPSVSRRRRSITSNLSLASTADLTCDTGITTPARTSSPSPKLPAFVKKTDQSASTGASKKSPGVRDPAVQALEKKRCISFACVARPTRDAKAALPPRQAANATSESASGEAPKRCAIKFACPARPTTDNRPLQQAQETAYALSPKPVSLKDRSPSTLRKARSPSTTRAGQSITPKRSSQSPTVRFKRYLSANSKDLKSEYSKFHEFASDEPEEDDWIRLDDAALKHRLTIDDLLEKENAIRKLGKEAEEEAELEEELGEEEEERDAEDDDDDGDDDDDDETAGVDEDRELDADVGSPGGEGEDFDEGYPGYGLDDGGDSDGYNTDNEVGFAESDDEDDGLVLWTTGEVGKLLLLSPDHARVQPSLGETSDSSQNAKRRHRSNRTKNMKIHDDTPELPDSTDFVCGTLDEDRPLEEAYISCMAARKREKLHLIPQDIDPSFPTSEPEDDAEDMPTRGYAGNDDRRWALGELEDTRHKSGRGDKEKHKENASPRWHHSPPPKRHPSPAPKPRGRSPSRLFDRQSPRKCKSPPPAHGIRSPPATPVHYGRALAFKSLAVNPKPVYTKSLPKTPAIFTHHAKKRGRSGTLTKETHIRGAIDIVKGLEQKRQRRKEKFYQKYCSRARKNQAQGRRPVPGQGAQRMREVGLIMAGKMGPGNYVLSV